MAKRKANCKNCQFGPECECALGKDQSVGVECFEPKISRSEIKCSKCGGKTRDWDIYRRERLCRGCIIGDESEQDTIQESSSLARMEDWAVDNYNWYKMNKQLGKKMKELGIPMDGFKGGLKL